MTRAKRGDRYAQKLNEIHFHAAPGALDLEQIGRAGTVAGDGAHAGEGVSPHFYICLLYTSVRGLGGCRRADALCAVEAVWG